MGRKRRAAILFLLVILILALAAAGIVLLFKINQVKLFHKQLSLGEKYLAELDYENAELAYKKAIQIDDKKAAPYLNLSVVYLAQGRYGESEEILRQAVEAEAAAEGNAELEAQKEMIQKEREKKEKEKKEEEEAEEEKRKEQEALWRKQEAVYEAYGQLIEEREAEYGALGAKSYPGEGNIWMTGLSFAKLVDFDGDGWEELLLSYDRSGTGSEHRYEIWTEAGDGSEEAVIEKADEGQLYIVSNGGVQQVFLTQYEERWYLKTGNALGTSEYRSFGEDGSFQSIRKTSILYSENEREISYRIDEREVSAEVWAQEESAWQEHMETYTLQGEVYDGLERLIQETKDTIKQKAAEARQKQDGNTAEKETASEQDQTAKEQKAESEENGTPDDAEIYRLLTEHYKEGTDDAPGDELTVMEGETSGGVYYTFVRCPVPGNPYGATQNLYEVTVDVATGEVTEIRVLTDNRKKTYNLYEES